jgi:hypothetical protein
VEQEHSWPTTLSVIIVASVASPMFTKRLVLNKIFFEKVGGLDLLMNLCCLLSLLIFGM